MHNYADASGFISPPKAELFGSRKRWQFIGQNKVNICKSQSQNFKFLVKKIGFMDKFIVSA